MTRVQTEYSINPDPEEPPKAKIMGIDRQPGSTPCLELQVKIGDRDRNVLLELGALEGHGLGGPAAVEVLRSIQSTLEDLVRALERRLETTESHSTDDQR